MSCRRPLGGQRGLEKPRPSSWRRPLATPTASRGIPSWAQIPGRPAMNRMPPMSPPFPAQACVAPRGPVMLRVPRVCEQCAAWACPPVAKAEPRPPSAVRPYCDPAMPDARRSRAWSHVTREAAGHPHVMRDDVGEGTRGRQTASSISTPASRAGIGGEPGGPGKGLAASSQAGRTLANSALPRWTAAIVWPGHDLLRCIVPRRRSHHLVGPWRAPPAQGLGRHLLCSSPHCPSPVIPKAAADSWLPARDQSAGSLTWDPTTLPTPDEAPPKGTVADTSAWYVGRCTAGDADGWADTVDCRWRRA